MPVKVPKLCHFKPRNLACVWITPTRRLYLGPWGSPESHERYAEVVRRLLLGLDVSEAPTLSSTTTAPSSMLTVRQLAERFIDFAQSYYVNDGVPTGSARVVELSVNAAVEKYGDLPASDFGPLALEAVRDQMVDNGLSRKTVNDRIGRLVAMFKWGAAKELVPSTTHHSLTMMAGLRAGRTKARESAPVRPVADDVIEATLGHLPPVVGDMVRFQRLTGARPSEVCTIRPCDIDRTTPDVWLYSPAKHKTAHHGKTRTVFIGPQAQEIILRYLARRSDAYCFSPADSESKRRADRHASRTTPLSCGNRPGTNVSAFSTRRLGDRYTKDSYGRAVARACKAAKVESWSPNQLRHTYATAVRRDHGLEAAQVLLGHSGAKTTEIYAERDYEKGAAVARLIG